MEKGFTAEQKIVLELVAEERFNGNIPENLMEFFEKQYINNPKFSEITEFTERITQDAIYYLLGDLDLKPADDIYELRDKYAELQEHCWYLEEEIDDCQYEISELRDFIAKNNLEFPE